jgi:3-hydroxypropanoate dehydrogenase
MAINDEALDVIFRAARTHRAWQDKPVTPAILMAIYDLMRWGPTAMNSGPLRIVFATSPEAKDKIRPHLAAKNVPIAMEAPVTAILAHDLDFARHAPTLNPYLGKIEFSDAAKETFALRNGSLQGAYFIVALRALGLDCCPISGFDNAAIDRAFFAGTSLKSNFLCAFGYGDAAKLAPRAARLSFDEACTIV